MYWISYIHCLYYQFKLIIYGLLIIYCELWRVFGCFTNFIWPLKCLLKEIEELGNCLKVEPILCKGFQYLKIVYFWTSAWKMGKYNWIIMIFQLRIWGCPKWFGKLYQIIFKKRGSFSYCVVLARSQHWELYSVPINKLYFLYFCILKWQEQIDSIWQAL